MKQLLIAFVLCTALLAPAVLAEPLEVSITPGSQTVAPNTTAMYRLEVKNNQPLLDTFYVSYTGERLGWLMTRKTLLKVGPGATVNMNVSLYPKAEGAYTYQIALESQANSSVEATGELTLNVLVPRAVQVSAFDVEKAGSELEVLLELDSEEKEQAELLLTLKNAAGQTVQTLPSTEEVFGRTAITKRIPLTEMVPGEYSIEALVEGGAFSKNFSIPAIHDVSQEVQRSANPLYEEITIVVTNNGNVVENSFEVTQEIPQGDFITGFLTPPEDCQKIDKTTVCLFVVPKLRPGESERIIYRMDFWPSYAKVAAAIIILIILSLLYWLKFTKPQIKKVFRRTKGSHSVVLEIKGPPLRKLRNVVVRDWVSPLAKVLHEEFTHLKPVLRKSDAGTELIWRLGDIAAREERVISYKIKSLVEGQLKMPRAYMRYRDSKDNKLKVYSRPILIH